jgi:hypothetical protein
MKRFINWLIGRKSPKTPPRIASVSRNGAHLRQTGSHLRQTGAHTVSSGTKPKPAQPTSQPEYVGLNQHADSRIEDNGPGKNVLVRNKYLREDTGTHETLKILDDSLVDAHEEEGIDPYNTGRFDRSRNWDRRNR